MIIHLIRLGFYPSCARFLLLKVYHQYRVDVSEVDDRITVYGFIPGTPLSSNNVATLAYPIVLTPRIKHAYFVEREGFDPLAMLKSPMMLMMIGTGVLLFLTPYLMVRSQRPFIS